MRIDCPPWPIDCTCLPPEWACDPLDWDDTQTDAVAMASAILRALTGGVYGPCPKFVRPCSPDNGSPCTGACGCSPICQVTLGAYVSSVISITQDGEVLPDNAWTLYNYAVLVRTDGDCFPACQPLDRPLTEPGTWGILYNEGLEVADNPLARRAVTRLAVEIWRDCNGGTCALPERVTQVTREGVTYTLSDTTDLANMDRFGIHAIDGFLDAVNPGRLRRPMGVYSPDMPRRYYPTNLEC